MSTSEPRIARDYLTPTGLPVRVAAATGAAIMLQSLSSDNRFAVPLSYPLAPLNGESNWALRVRPYTKRSEKESRTASSPLKPLAPLIDAMLLAGGMTMRGILRELRRKASAACRDKNLHANVRARLYWLRQKGGSVHWDASGRIQVK